MRTTVDLPEDLHRIARSIASDTHETLSETIAMLMRRGLGEPSPVRIEHDPVSGLPVVYLGRIITSEDVRSLEDEE